MRVFNAFYVNFGFRHMEKTDSHPSNRTQVFSAKSSSSYILLIEVKLFTTGFFAGEMERFINSSFPQMGSIFKGSNSAGFADEVLQEVVVHFCKA